MAKKLLAWNKGNAHGDALRQIRAQLAGVCAKLPAGDPARKTCDGVWHPPGLARPPEAHDEEPETAANGKSKAKKPRRARRKRVPKADAKSAAGTGTKAEPAAEPEAGTQAGTEAAAKAGVVDRGDVAAEAVP